MRSLIIISILIALPFISNGQERQLRGKVIDAQTGNPVSYASVLIKNKGRGMGATGEGKFKFNITLNDTLQISSIGYETLTLPITEQLDLTEEQIFKVFPTVYDLDSIQVIQLTDDFYLKRPKFDTLDLGLPKPSIIRDWNQIQTLPLTNGEAGIVITGFLNDFDKNIRQQRIINAFEKADQFTKERITKREKYFNKDLVKRVTRIDDRVIDEFMEFCNFLDGQIIGKSEYEITLLILEKYKAFLVR